MSSIKLGISFDTFISDTGSLPKWLTKLVFRRRPLGFCYVSIILFFVPMSRNTLVRQATYCVTGSLKLKKSCIWLKVIWHACTKSITRFGVIRTWHAKETLNPGNPTIENLKCIRCLVYIIIKENKNITQVMQGFNSYLIPRRYFLRNITSNWTLGH